MNDRFTRASGAGNTFFIANVFDSNWSQNFSKISDQDKSRIAHQVCEGDPTLKTDGLLFIRPEPGFDFAWDFFNSDGSKAEMCGNAARCATLFFYERIKKQKLMRFKTIAGEITGEVLENGDVRVQMTRVHDLKPMTVLGFSGVFVNSGVPHFVIKEKSNAEIAKKLRKVNDFGPAGANITFAQKISSNEAKAVTFERGVEDFTQACGTGAVAAAMWLQYQEGSSPLVKVEMPGGLLTVENAKEGQRPLLIGPTILEFDMNLSERT